MRIILIICFFSAAFTFQAQNSYIKVLDISRTNESADQIIPYNGNFLVSYQHINNSYTNLFSGILEIDGNANIIRDKRFIDFSNNHNAIVIDTLRSKLFYTGEEYTLTNIPQSYRIYELDYNTLDSIRMIEVIDSNRIYPIIYQINSLIHNDQLVVSGQGNTPSNHIMTAYINLDDMSLDTITHIGEPEHPYTSISATTMYTGRDGSLVHHAKVFGDSIAIIKVDANKRITQTVIQIETKCFKVKSRPACLLSDGRSVYNRCGTDELPEIVFLADSTYDIVDKFEWRKNLPAESPYPARQGRKTFKLIEAHNGDIIGVGSIRWSDAPTPNFIDYAPLIFRINNKGDLLWYKVLYNTSNISAWTIGTLCGVTELEDGSIIAVGDLHSDIEYDSVLQQPVFQPDILIVRLSADGCIDSYNCKDIFYKVPEVTSLTTSTQDVTPDAIKKHHVKVYPNPSSGFLTVSLDDRYRRVMIGIYNMQGQLIEKYYDLSTDKVELNLSHLASATYVYKIYDGPEVIETGEWVKM